MLIRVQSMYHCDIIDCPDDLSFQDLQRLQMEYDILAVKEYLLVSPAIFYEWVNETRLKNHDKKIVIVLKTILPEEKHKALPTIYY